MKMRKILGLLLTVVMCCSLFTGCVGNIGEVTIAEDGSGSVKMSIGIEEEAYKAMAEAEGTTTDSEELVSFEYNGVKYLGQVVESKFKTLEELNTLLTTEDDNGAGGMNVDTGVMTFSKNDNGDIVYVLKADASTGDTSAIEKQYSDSLTVEGSASASVEMDEETEKALEEMMKTMAVVFEITFPYNVEKTTGMNTDGIIINGKNLKVDFVKVSEDLAGKEDTFTFVASNNDSSSIIAPENPKVETPSELEAPSFIDVPADAWYYKAVINLAAGGLVLGVGDNRFAPQETLTYAQFCQIVARAEGLETGEKNGYWAYKAIESCRNKGYIVDLGAYTSDNYDVAMPREAAVAGMFRAKATEYLAEGKVGSDIRDTDIPDYKDIDDNYKNDVLDAYNCGITNGMDSHRTFNPKGILTRAEVCQLFYNVNWIVAK